MGRVRILLAALAAAGLAACGEAPAPKPAAKGEGLKTAAVELREVELTTTAEAVMEAVRQSTVSAQIAGRIVELRFDVGDYVKKGDVIVRIDERSAARALEASEAQVRRSRRRRSRTRARSTSARSSSSRRNSSARPRSTRPRPTTRRRRRASARSSPAPARRPPSAASPRCVAPYSGVVMARHVAAGRDGERPASRS